MESVKERSSDTQSPLHSSWTSQPPEKGDGSGGLIPNPNPNPNLTPTQTVDPDFSIYTASLPYAVRRALSPQTSRGAQKLRGALLTADGQFRWSRLQEVLAQVRCGCSSELEFPSPGTPGV